MARSFKDIARSRAKSKGLDLRTRAGKESVNRSIASQKGHRRRQRRETKEAKKKGKEKEISKILKKRVRRAMRDYLEGSNVRENFSEAAISIDRVRNVAIVQMKFFRNPRRGGLSFAVDLEDFHVEEDDKDYA